MTIRELINLLLDCDMNTEIKIGFTGRFGDDIKEIIYDEFDREYAIVKNK